MPAPSEVLVPVASEPAAAVPVGPPPSRCDMAEVEAGAKADIRRRKGRRRRQQGNGD
jgi:hypothetical protein